MGHGTGGRRVRRAEKMIYLQKFDNCLTSAALNLLAALNPQGAPMNPRRITLMKWIVSLGLAVVLVVVPVCTFAQTATPTTHTSPAPVPPVANACTRFTAGSVIQNPPALYSDDGVLNVQFSYQATTDSVGRQLFCFMTPDGLENPTLHVNPGDTLNIAVTNNTPTTEVNDNDTDEPFNPPNCDDTVFELQAVPPSNVPPVTFGMMAGSMNIHYH